MKFFSCMGHVGHASEPVHPSALRPTPYHVAWYRSLLLLLETFAGFYESDRSCCEILHLLASNYFIGLCGTLSDWDWFWQLFFCCSLGQFLLTHQGFLFFFRPSNDARMTWRVIIVVNSKTNIVNFSGRYFRPSIKGVSTPAYSDNPLAFFYRLLLCFVLNPRDRYFPFFSWSEQFWIDPTRFQFIAVYCKPSQLRVQSHQPSDLSRLNTLSNASEMGDGRVPSHNSFPSLLSP